MNPSTFSARFVSGIFAAFLFLFTLAVPSAFAFSAGIESFALDTVAGYGTLLKTSVISPGQSVVFTVQNPSGQQLFYTAKSDASGVAKFDLPDYQTRMAGTYYVTAEFASTKIPGPPKPFRVSPDTVSSSRSTVEASSSVVRLGDGSGVTMKITLVDAYGNPFSNHLVRLLSTRTRDSIQAANRTGVTDAHGVVQFLVRSTEPGASLYTAYDLTGEVVLDYRPQILYTNNAFSALPVGGDDTQASTASVLSSSSVASTTLPLDASSNADRVQIFEFEDLPTTLYKNDPFTITVATYDMQKNVVSNYTGKIHFSIKGTNGNLANLPDDYTFLDQDLGKHTFSLGFQFQQSGTYTLRVEDTANKNIYGEKDLVIGDARESKGTASGNVALTSPSNGKSRDNLQNFSGTTQPGKDVKFFDNNVEIGKATAGLDGAFHYTTSALADGEHVFYAAAVDEAGTVLGTSDKVTVTVDNTPPTLGTLTFDPNVNVAPGSPVVVTVISEAHLSKSSLVIDEVSYDLTATGDRADAYTASIAAPKKPGDYTFQILLADEVGNEAVLKDQGLLKVTGSQIPGPVSHLEAQAGNGMVNLVWGAAKDDKGVVNYRVYYGTAFDALTEKVDTHDNATTWYIPDLQNGVSYFFKVVAIDEDGQEGESVDPVSALPDASLELLFPSAPDVMGETGPEVLWLLFPSFFGARLLRKRTVRVK